MTTRCAACHAETDAFLCRRCLVELDEWLAEVPTLASELQTVATRRHSFPPGAGAISSEKPLPFHATAADAAWVLANTTTTWARHIAEARGVEINLPGVPILRWAVLPRDRQTGPQPGRSQPELRLPVHYAEQTAGEASRWLRASIDAIRHDESAGECYDELRDAIRLAERRCVPPPPSWYAGPCDECDSDMTIELDDSGRPAAEAVVCEACGHSHDLAGRREKLIELAGDKLMTGTMALSSVKILMDADVPRGTWDTWVARERVIRRGTDDCGRPLFRFSDVHALVLDWLHAKSDRGHKRQNGGKRQVGAR